MSGLVPTAAQSSMLVAPVELVVAKLGHALHATVSTDEARMAVSRYLPTAHLMQLGTLVPGWYCPVGQSAHLRFTNMVGSTVMKRPAGHVVCTVHMTCVVCVVCMMCV